MNIETAKATYINLFLLAVSDGRIDPQERDYLKRFAAVAKITDGQARRWTDEVKASGKIQFRPINEPEEVRNALAVMARMVRVDGEFGPEEQAAYVNMGKAIGLAPEELGVALREYWDNDPLPQPTPPPVHSAPQPISAAQPAPAPGTALLVIIQDNIDDTVRLNAALDTVPFQTVSMESLERIATPPRIVIFHAAEDKKDSTKRLAMLKERFGEISIAFIARRDQAPQIGYLLEQGAARCFVEPLYPGEISRAKEELLKS